MLIEQLLCARLVPGTREMVVNYTDRVLLPWSSILVEGGKNNRYTNKIMTDFKYHIEDTTRY